MNPNSDFFYQKFLTNRYDKVRNDRFNLQTRAMNDESVLSGLGRSSYNSRYSRPSHTDNSYSQMLEKRIDQRLRDLIPKLELKSTYNNDLQYMLFENDRYLSDLRQKGSKDHGRIPANDLLYEQKIKKQQFEQHDFELKLELLRHRFQNEFNKTCLGLPKQRESEPTTKTPSLFNKSPQTETRFMNNSCQLRSSQMITQNQRYEILKEPLTSRCSVPVQRSIRQSVQMAS